MPQPLITEAEADQISAAPKSIDGDLKWEYDPSTGPFAKAVIPVRHDFAVELRVHATVNLKEPSRITFALVASRNFRIRGLCINRSHGNKHTNNEKWRPGTHMHRWTNKCRDRFAHTPHQHISMDVERAFIVFCKECDISFTGKVMALPVLQLGLDDVR